jgi:hypothetical protein
LIDSDSFLRSSEIGIGHFKHGRGGQELLLHEIVGMLEGHDVVWVPFPGCEGLVGRLGAMPIEVLTGMRTPPGHVDALYFGTPTIVKSKPLFPRPEFEGWDKHRERREARRVCRSAEHAGARTIISGLGAGDVGWLERAEDMGGQVQTAVFKKFQGFDDWVLLREISKCEKKSSARGAAASTLPLF